MNEDLIRHYKEVVTELVNERSDTNKRLLILDEVIERLKTEKPEDIFFNNYHGSDYKYFFNLKPETYKLKPKKVYRPYKLEEAYRLLDKKVTLTLELSFKTSRVISFVQSCGVNFDTGGWDTFENLLKYYIFEDGSPVGVLENG